MTDYPIDAQGKPLGRVASEIAIILQGKKSPRYDPRLVGGDRALIKNVTSIVVTGKKTQEKRYHRHTGYMGHLKSKTFGDVFARDPQRVLLEAVRRMLPKNKLNKQRLKNVVFVK